MFICSCFDAIIMQLNNKHIQVKPLRTIMWIFSFVSHLISFVFQVLSSPHALRLQTCFTPPVQSQQTLCFGTESNQQIALITPRQTRIKTWLQCVSSVLCKLTSSSDQLTISTSVWTSPSILFQAFILPFFLANVAPDAPAYLCF